MNQSYRNLRTDGTLFSWNTYSSKMVSGINCLFHFVIITSNTSCCDLFCLKGTSTIANFKYMWIQGHTVHVPYCSFPVLKWDGIRFRLCTFSDPARNAVSLSLKLATDERNLTGSAGTSWILFHLWAGWFYWSQSFDRLQYNKPAGFFLFWYDHCWQL